MKIGEFPGVNVELARRIVDENKAYIAQGFDPISERTKRINPLTFQQFAEQYYLPEIILRKKSWLDDERKLKKDMYGFFGGKPLAEISKKDVTTYINMILQRTSKSTANRHLSLIKSMLQLAVSLEFIDKNAGEGVKKFQEPKGRTRFLSDSEITRLLEALDNSKQRESVLAIKLLLLTGMRKLEGLTLRWADNVFLAQGVIQLTPGTTKNGEGRTVYLNSLAQEVLEELAKNRRPSSEWVFEGKVPGNHLTTMRKTFEKALQDAGIEHIPLHTLRHTFASRLCNLGVDIRSIQELLGHKNISQTVRYSHLASSTLKAATELAVQNMGQASQRP